MKTTTLRLTAATTSHAEFLTDPVFNDGSESPSENHPQAGIDVLLKGLSSIRVKSPEGAEVEAKRGK